MKTRLGSITHVGYGTIRLTGIFALALWTTYAAGIGWVVWTIIAGIYRS